MVAIYLLLGFVSIVYLVVSGYMDLKERLIYGFPALILAVCWSGYCFAQGKYEVNFLIAFWLTHLAIYVVMNRLHIWGAGDSDVFLLMSSIVLVVNPFEMTYQTLVFECAVLIAAMACSIVIGKVEAAIKRERVDKNYGVAVIPGMSIVLSICCVYGMVRGCW